MSSLRKGRFKGFLGNVRSRKLIHVVAIYASSSLTVLGALNLFLRQYNFSSRIFDVLLVFLVCGLPAALVFRWHHATQEKRRFQPKEVLLYGIFLAVALLTTLRLVTLPRLIGKSPDEKSIAVLPFQNMSGSKEDEYFSDGVTEDIITQLSKIEDLKVISRTSVMAYKETKKNVREIGRELNVAAILEGSVRRVNDRVRIVGQLIDARKDKHLWAETYDRQLTDIFEIQSEVAKRIAAELKARMSADEKERIEKKPTESVDAYAYYMKGRENYYKYTREDNEQAIEFFKKALDLDPNYALAYAGLGDAYSRKSLFSDRRSEWLDLATEMSKKAIAKGPGFAEGYKALGLAIETAGNFHEALDAYYKAVALNPNYAPVVVSIGTVNYSLGKYDEAVKWLRKGTELQPGFARYYALVGFQYYHLNYDRQARVWLERALEFQPGDVFPQLVLIYLDISAQKQDEAKARLSKLVKAHPDERNVLDAAGDLALLSGDDSRAKDYYEKLSQLTSLLGSPGNKLACALIKLGESARASKILDENLAFCLSDPGLDRPGSESRYYIAQAYALQQKRAEAIDSLRKAIELGYRERWIFLDPLLENIRGEVPFKKVIEDLQNQIAAMRKHVQELGLDK